jgi:hypothetical protein
MSLQCSPSNYFEFECQFGFSIGVWAPLTTDGLIRYLLKSLVFGKPFRYYPHLYSACFFWSFKQHG